MKTEIIVTLDDNQHKDYKRGDIGYIDGYVQAADNRSYAVVVLSDRKIKLIPTYALEARIEYKF